MSGVETGQSFHDAETRIIVISQTDYSRDAMNRMKRLIDTKSNVTTWNYDARGSLTGKVYTTGDTHTTPNGDICTW